MYARGERANDFHFALSSLEILLYIWRYGNFVYSTLQCGRIDLNNYVA